MDHQTTRDEGRLQGIWQRLILALSLYVLAQLSLEVILEIPVAVAEVLSLVDLGICIIFLADWLYSFLKAQKKGRYAVSRFFDLVSSIPYLQVLRPLRIVRIVRIFRALRLLRGIKGLVPVLRYLSGNLQRSALAIYLSITSLVYFYCSLGLYNSEKNVNESIRSFGDALWMAFITMASVGVGDISPKTAGGRVMSILLILTGMGLFSLVTAELATVFLRRIRSERKEPG